MSETQTVLAEGTLYLTRIISGVSQGRSKIPGVAAFKISPKADKKEATTKDKGQYGQVVGTILLPQPTELGISITQVTGVALGMALMGELSTLSIGGGTVTDEVVAADKLGTFLDLAQSNITAASVVVQDVTDVTTYTEGTDYEVNYAMGWVSALVGGAITALDVLHIDYAHGAVSGQRVRGSTLTEVRGRFELDGRNLADGKELSIDVYEGVLASDGEVDFMSDDFVELSMSGSMVTPVGKTEPYIIDFDKTLS